MKRYVLLDCPFILFVITIRVRVRVRVRVYREDDLAAIRPE